MSRSGVTVASIGVRPIACVLVLFLGLTARAQDTPTARGDAAMEARKYDEAVAAYTEAIQQEPKKAERYKSSPENSHIYIQPAEIFREGKVGSKLREL